MLWYDIDLNKEPQKPILILCRPNRDEIGQLDEAYNIKLNVKLGEVNELSFIIPYEVDEMEELVRNEHIDLIKEKYLIKLVIGENSEWFEIQQPSENSQDSGDSMDVKCFSQQIQLQDKIMDDYIVNTNVYIALSDCLEDTGWDIGVIDSDFFNTREFDIKSTKKLDFTNKVAETINGINLFDTENKTLSIFKPEDVGQDKGLIFSYDNYLKSISKTINNKPVTRLYLKGKDDLGIEEIVVNARPYIEDYSYYMDLKWMSQELIDALIEYKQHFDDFQVQFDDLLVQLQPKQILYDSKQNELSVLKQELLEIENNIDKNSYNPTERIKYIIQLAAKKLEVKNKEEEIEVLNGEIQTIYTSIHGIRLNSRIENFLTPEQMEELTPFIIESQYSNTSITNTYDLLNSGKEEFDKLKKPQEVIKISVVNFLEIVEENDNWDKLSLGDIVNIWYEKFKINTFAQIMEISFDFESGNIDLTIATDTAALKKRNQFLDIGKAIQTTNMVEEKKNKWNSAIVKAEDALAKYELSIDATSREIVAGADSNVKIDNRGISSANVDDPNKKLQIQNGGIFLSDDNFETIKTAISTDGVMAEQLIGKVLVSKKLTIEAKNEDGTTTHFTVDNQGVKLSGNHLIIEQGNNGIMLDTSQGLVITTDNKQNRVILNATSGFKVQFNAGTVENPNYEDIFYIDSVTAKAVWKTSSSGSRLEIDDTGLRQYDSNGNLLVDFTNGESIFYGKVETKQDAEIGNNLYLGEPLNLPDMPPRTINANGKTTIKMSSGDLGTDIEVGCENLKLDGYFSIVDDKTYFKTYRDSAPQSVTVDTWVKVQFEVESYQDTLVFDQTLNRYVAPRDGKYNFTSSVSFSNTSNMSMAIYVNGVRKEYLFDGVSGKMASGAIIKKLNAYDYVEIYVKSSIDNTIETGSDKTYFTGCMLH